VPGIGEEQDEAVGRVVAALELMPTPDRLDVAEVISSSIAVRFSSPKMTASQARRSHRSSVAGSGTSMRERSGGFTRLRNSASFEVWPASRAAGPPGKSRTARSRPSTVAMRYSSTRVTVGILPASIQA
jgi:hypothetical protein